MWTLEILSVWSSRDAGMRGDAESDENARDGCEKDEEDELQMLRGARADSGRDGARKAAGVEGFW